MEKLRTCLTLGSQNGSMSSQMGEMEQDRNRARMTFDECVSRVVHELVTDEQMELEDGVRNVFAPHLLKGDI